MTPGRKLCLSAVAVIASAAYFGTLGAASSWQYYLTVDEAVGRFQTIGASKVRVNGRVVADSLRIADDRRSAEFVLEGESAQLRVNSSGVVPDNLAAGIEVVVEGRMQNDLTFEGDNVLTRCASKYASQR